MGVTQGLEICHGQCWVLSCLEHFRRGLERMLAKGMAERMTKGMEADQKWMQKDYKESEKGTGGETGLGRG